MLRTHAVTVASLLTSSILTGYVQSAKFADSDDGNELLRNVNIDDLEPPKYGWGFSDFFFISGCDMHFKSELCPNG